MNALVLLPVLVPLTAAALGLVAWQSPAAQRLIALVGSAVLLAVGIVLFLVVSLAVGMVNGACRATTLEGVLRESLRSEYSVGQTLKEQLAEAVEHEQYELAARLRDELSRREMS